MRSPHRPATHPRNPWHSATGWRILAVLAALLLTAILLGRQYEDVREIVRVDAKTHFALREYRSLDEWQARRAHLRRQILVAAGLYPLPERQPLKPLRFDPKEFESYRVEKVLIEPFPGFFLAGNLYTPKQQGRKLPGVLVPHGHWKHGRAHNTADYSVPALCANLAAQGYVAFAYDMVGYNDTRQLPHDFGGSSQEMLWSFSPLGVQLWDSIRALDFLQSLPEVDPARIGVTGASGGATQTILLAAVDDRVTASAPVNMVSASFQGDDACEMAPGLRVGTNNVEIASLMAPRPMLLVSATGDWTRNTPRLEFPAVESIYRLYGRKDRVSSVQIDARHNYNARSRQAVYSFFRKQLHRGRGAVPAKEIDVSDLRAEDLLIGPEKLPQGLNREQLFSSWRAREQRQEETLDAAQLREQLMATLDVSWPLRINVLPAGKRVLLENSDTGETVPVRWMPGRGSGAALIVNPEWSEAATETPEIRRDLDRGLSVLLLDAFRTGSGGVLDSSTDRAFLTYHLSDDANRVHDIVTAIAFLAARQAGEIRMRCPGIAGSWCVLAAAVAPVRVDLAVDVEWREAPTADSASVPFIPGLKRAGGLRAAMQMLETGQAQLAGLPTPADAARAAGFGN